MAQKREQWPAALVSCLEVEVLAALRVFHGLAAALSQGSSPQIEMTDPGCHAKCCAGQAGAHSLALGQWAFHSNKLIHEKGSVPVAEDAEAADIGGLMADIAADECHRH
jgi:hypothetical protein